MSKPRVRLGIGCLLLAGAPILAPGAAGADPVNDFLCSVGSSAPEFCLAVPPSPGPPPHANNPGPPPHPVTPYTYQNCTQARLAGAAPLYRWEPGYSPRLDPDRDGVACE
ncbi:MAG: excalibur calcium-binding domain-containing protein [Aldersonia sp.]|nr:excalibur calcium-binding domain-containing protein [Aldersonia sp.]